MPSTRSGVIVAVALFVSTLLSAPSSAQNVTNYVALPDPLLLLIREPAVLDELQLSASQRSAILEFNRKLDGPLLSSRNQPAAQQRDQVATWLSDTRDRLKSVLNSRQIQRLSQIQLRVRGYRSLLDTTVAKRLRLTDEQRDKIQREYSKLTKDLEAIQERINEGESRPSITGEAKRLQQGAQSRIIAVLTQDQQRTFLAMVGRPFDVNKLSRVRFQAPEFAAADQWLNSSPLKMADLRGKVIALHFFAYG